MSIVFSRHWGMPSADTFDCPPIRGFVDRYLVRSMVSIDPFARNFKGATWTNDLNVDTTARYHLDARKFLGLMKSTGVVCDLMLLDPPYSPRQISECYKEIGVPCTMEDTQNGAFYKAVRDAVMLVVKPGSFVLSFGWNSAGMGKSRDFELREVLLVAHGGAHNDTICIAEEYCPRPTQLTLHP